ncbi:hypothetical protein D3C85_1332020 [compost metagenome]
MHAQHQNGEPGFLCTHELEELQAGLVGQLNIDQRHVEILLPDQEHCVLCRRGFARYVDLAGSLQHASHAITHDAVIIHQQDSDFVVNHLYFPFGSSQQAMESAAELDVSRRRAHLHFCLRR